MKIEVQKGIPFPKRNQHGAVSSILRTMEVGDSFLVESHKERMSVMNTVCRFKPKKFISGIDGDNIRIWRTE